MYRVCYFLLIVVIASSCEPPSGDSDGAISDDLFEMIADDRSGVYFSNDLEFTEEYNPYTFKNFFNGGGVALGDINNDGLLDLYFSGNLVDNKLYLNKGDFQFEDVTSMAGVACTDVWSSGVSMVDINGDGLLDIYVCKSGKPEVSGVRHNELFINSGDGTFLESSAFYGLDFSGLAVHAVFFDYDLDGDLDCYLLNNSIRSVGGVDMVEGLRDEVNPAGGNKLLKSMLVETDGSQTMYEDVTQSAGIYASAIGFGLGVSVSDLNDDMWPDIYVSNDFFEKDYLYINNQDGTFTETIDLSMGELSMGSMGADIADLDNDGRPDIFVTEMLPATLERSKTKIVFDNYQKSQLATAKGYHRQYARNTLHHNQGQTHESKTPIFSEISRYAGVDATEWSWGALAEDFDQDGFKDLFIANGLYRDLLDQDYLNFFQPDEIRKRIQSGESDVMVRMFDQMPASQYPNYFFKNNGDLTFTDQSTDSGLGRRATYSNGSAYGDLDNDGDLDLVISNIGTSASIFMNTINRPSLTLALSDEGFNKQALGARVTAYTSTGQMVKEVYPMRGFESSVDPRVQFAFGDVAVDSIVVRWPDRTLSKYSGDLPDSTSVSTIMVKRDSEIYSSKDEDQPMQLLERREIFDGDMVHKESLFSDFDKVRTLPFMLSNEGPRIAVADMNKDGLEDLILGNSKGSPASICINTGKALSGKSSFRDLNLTGESLDILVQDLDGDGMSDIFFANGSSEFGNASSGIRDQLYLCNQSFCKPPAGGFMNVGFSCSSAVEEIDIDNDGDRDLIVGERMKPNAYGVPGDILRYRNDDGTYTRLDPEGVYRSVGLIRDMAVGDVNADGIDDIIVASEYAPLEILLGDENGGHVKSDLITAHAQYSGIWNRIEVNDFDDDGDLDIIASNIGENNRVARISDSLSVLYVNDFDQNGSVETILCSRTARGDFPLSLRDDLVMQLPILKKKALKYADFARLNMEDLFDEAIIAKSIIYKLNEYRTGIFVNEGGRFQFEPLPKEAQWTDQRAIWVGDINGDGRKDLILGGNQYLGKPELGISAASYGQVFLQDKDNKFRYLRPEQSGLHEYGQIRDIADIMIDGSKYILLARNNARVAAYKINSK